jgi:hypothetical protein
MLKSPFYIKTGEVEKSLQLIMNDLTWIIAPSN